MAEVKDTPAAAEAAVSELYLITKRKGRVFMKKHFSSVVHWAGAISFLGMLISLFMPFFCYSFLGQRSEEHVLFEFGSEILDEFHGIVGSSELQKAGETYDTMCVGLLVCLVIMLFALVFWGAGEGIGQSIVVFICSVVEWSLYNKLSSVIFSSSLVEKLNGAVLMEWSCVGFIVTSVLALLVDIIYLSWRVLKVEFVSSTTENLQCPHCGKEYSKGDAFCGGCGHELEKLVCPKCGEKYTYKDSFCKKCGEKLCVLLKE